MPGLSIARWRRILVPIADKTERRMVLLQWFIMPLVLAGCLLPRPRPHEYAPHALIAAAIMLAHPLLYIALSRRYRARDAFRNVVLTATDVTVATLVFYSTVARPGYAQVLLYCTVALAATRYAAYRAFGITSLIALLLLFAALLPLRLALPDLASEVMGLYALTYLVGLLSRAESTVAQTSAENARLAQTVLRRNRELSALNRLSRTLNAESDPRGVLRLGLLGMAEALELDDMRAYTVDDDGLRRVASVPSDPPLPTPAPHAGVIPAVTGSDMGERGERNRDELKDEAVRAVARRTAVTCWSTMRSVDVPLAGPPRFSSEQVGYVTIPLIVYGRVGAVVQARLPRGATATATATVETLEVFCGELAVALENAQLRGEAHRNDILQEKNRIAQELHDTVLQILFSIGLRLEWSLEQIPDASPLRAALAEAKRLSARAGGELRGAIFTLSSDIAEVGLVAAVERLVDEQASKAGWSANVVVSGAAPDLPVLVQNAAHRVVREALMNAYKYARAGELVVSLRFTPDALTVVAQDNGVGIPAETLRAYRETPDHFGLRTIAEQIEGLGGEFSVYNNDDALPPEGDPGTTVKAVIPLTRAAGAQLPFAS